MHWRVHVMWLMDFKDQYEPPSHQATSSSFSLGLLLPVIVTVSRPIYVVNTLKVTLTDCEIIHYALFQRIAFWLGPLSLHSSDFCYLLLAGTVSLPFSSLCRGLSQYQSRHRRWWSSSETSSCTASSWASVRLKWVCTAIFNSNHILMLSVCTCVHFGRKWWSLHH